MDRDIGEIPKGLHAGRQALRSVTAAYHLQIFAQRPQGTQRTHVGLPTSTVQIEPFAPVVEALETQLILREYPRPEDVQNSLKQGSGGINSQTSMNLDEAVAFYRAAFTALGLSEHQLLTGVEEDVFSMVFDGASNGLAVVFQGLRLGDDSLNINIRYEDV